MGSLPSSRLTRILQEKAELLKKRRQSAESTQRDAEARVRLLESAGVTLPETAQREGSLRDLTRRSDWEAVETQAKDLLKYLDEAGPAAVEARTGQLRTRAERAGEFTTPLASEVIELLGEVPALVAEKKWSAAVERLLAVDEATRAAEAEFLARQREAIRGLGAWTGASEEKIREVEAAARPLLDKIVGGPAKGASASLDRLLAEGFPDAAGRRAKARAVGESIESVARELGVPIAELGEALGADASAAPTIWPKSVPSVEAACEAVAGKLKERVGQAIESLRTTLESLRDFGADPTASLTALEGSLSRVPGATSEELPAILGEARRVTEEPVVAVVAGLLDEVRPRLVEARRLGRDPSDVFAAMNRAREALRLKIYSEALAAAQEALKRVDALTQDLETARAEVESLGDFLTRLERAKFPTGPFGEPLRRVQHLLDRVDLPPAQALLQETIVKLGREAYQHFHDLLKQLAEAAQVARDRAFLPPEFDAAYERARALLDTGNLGDAGEAIARLDVELRSAALPYVARRVEEIGRGLDDVPDETLVAPVRRLLADADVTLRVKENLGVALESLKAAERAFAAVFATHASQLVETLESERRTLEAMGGAGDEIQRQIDEVQQIFNMGDFVKASHASQEIRTRAQQQQLVRSEEACSHAKLALVELGKMGLEPLSLRTVFETAQEAVKAGRCPEGYRRANECLESATKLKAHAQAILDLIAQVTELWQALRQAGVQVDSYRETLAQARQAYQGLDFERARGTLVELRGVLETESQRSECQRLLAEAELLGEDCRRLGLPAGETAGPELQGIRQLLESGPPAEALARVRTLHADLVTLVRPVLEANLRGLEDDLEVPRAAGLDVQPTATTLAEGRRRLALPVPTGVAELLETARGQFAETRGFLEHAERAIRRAKDALDQAELVHVDVRQAKPHMEKIDQHLERRDFARAIEIASALERELAQATYQQVSKSLAGFQGMLVRAREAGAHTTLAENLLQQARQELDGGRPLEALQLAARSEAELERTELQVRIARGSLESIEARAAHAQADGVRTPGGFREVERARAAFQEKRYPDVLEHVITASDALASATENHRHAREALELSERAVKDASELGADVAEALGRLEQARAGLAGGEYFDAVRHAREAAEGSRWAIDRLYAGAVADVRAMVEQIRAGPTTTDADAIERLLEAADAGLKERQWSRATEALASARQQAEASVDRLLDARTAEVEALAPDASMASDADTAAREAFRTRLVELRTQRRFAPAFELLREEETRAREHQRRALMRKVGELQERLLVGERLGADTTPVMEIFSEAKLALEAGQIAPIAGLLRKGDQALERIVGVRLAERVPDVEREMIFAGEGLHVTLGDVPELVDRARSDAGQGRVVDGARALLEAEDQLNRRKAMHRELLNLHYLVDAALARAMERHLDTGLARRLLEESIRVRASDYGAALEKAREALAHLQAMLKEASSPAPNPIGVSTTETTRT